jgi:ERCC4-type nuclease
MLIKIDIREADLIKSCTFLLGSMPCFKDLQIVMEALPIGDIILCNNADPSNPTTDLVIIERKSLRDLSASIKDGRYEEQSYRLNGLPHHNHNIVYLVEGSMERMNMFKGQSDKMMLYSAMVSINYFKGFSLWRSGSLDESALIICNAAYKIAKGLREHKAPYYKYVEPTVNKALEPVVATSLEPSFTLLPLLETTDLIDPKEENTVITTTVNVEHVEAEHLEKDYCSVIKKVKKENVTPGNIGEIMLCQIPSISSVTALAILAEFKTLPNLIESIKKDGACLKNLTYTTPAGQTRKISKACIDNVIKYLV